MVPPGTSVARLACIVVLAACGSAATGPVRVSTEPPKESVSRRVIAFAGDKVRLEGFPMDARPSTPLPAGLSLAGGLLTGVPSVPHPGTLYHVTGARSESTLYVEIVAPPANTDLVVAPDGDDSAPGTAARPLRTIATALERSGPGTRVFLRAGRYTEDVRITRGGAPGARLELRSYPGERAILEGSRVELAWTRSDAPEAAPDEFVSVIPIPAKRGENIANRAAFLDRTPYTRLLSYSRLEDLRATNERWVIDGSVPGPPQRKQPTRPWTYFGPGLWHDPDTGYVHLRLSPTHNRVARLIDFDGRYDPTTLRIGVWYRAATPLAIRGGHHVDVRDLTVFGGGERSVDVQHASDITLDHVDIFAGSEGLAIRHSTRVRYLHGRIDGGIPPWTFRSDFKDNYAIVRPMGPDEPNHLIRKTSRALLTVGDGNASIEVGYAELVNGHDNTFAGVGAELHHCLIENVNDDALFISHTTDIDALEIHHNVFRRVLTGLSGEGRRATGTKYVYRNIFDLRDPVAGFRPGLKDEVWRWGALFKGDFSAGPLFFYQNTILLNRPGEQAALMLFRSLEPNGVAENPRWFVNNIISVDTTARDQTLGFVPQHGYLAARRPDGTPVLRSDGNIWVRSGRSRAPMFRCMSRAAKCTTREWRDLRGLHDLGFERRSRIAPQAFARLRSTIATAPDDDLRLLDDPLLRDTGIELPAPLPDSTHAQRRDAGALAPGAPAMFVGVDGRHRY